MQNRSSLKSCFHSFFNLFSFTALKPGRVKHRKLNQIITNPSSKHPSSSTDTFDLGHSLISYTAYGYGAFYVFTNDWIMNKSLVVSPIAALHCHEACDAVVQCTYSLRFLGVLMCVSDAVQTEVMQSKNPEGGRHDSSV